MADHHNTAKQALKEHLGDMFKPSSYKVDIRADDFISVFYNSNMYDLVLLDRDCTLQKYHGKHVPQKFWHYLREGPTKTDGERSKLEIISNSSFDEFKRIRDVFASFKIPVSKLVKFDVDSDNPYLLRFDEDGKLSVHQYIQFDFKESMIYKVQQYVPFDFRESMFYNETTDFTLGDQLQEKISYHYKKPNPTVVQAVIDFNVQSERVPAEPKVLMVGDRYMTDIMAGNLAGVDTALVKPYKPLSDRPDLIATRYLIDLPVGAVMSRLAKK